MMAFFVLGGIEVSQGCFNLHGFALIAGQAYFFFLDKKEAKNQDDNDPSARRASTRLGVLVGPALLSWYVDDLGLK